MDDPSDRLPYDVSLGQNELLKVAQRCRGHDSQPLSPEKLSPTGRHSTSTEQDMLYVSPYPNLRRPLSDRLMHIDRRTHNESCDGPVPAETAVRRRFGRHGRRPRNRLTGSCGRAPLKCCSLSRLGPCSTVSPGSPRSRKRGAHRAWPQSMISARSPSSISHPWWMSVCVNVFDCKRRENVTRSDESRPADVTTELNPGPECVGEPLVSARCGPRPSPAPGHDEVLDAKDGDVSRKTAAARDGGCPI